MILEKESVKILVVDDEKAIRRSIKEILEFENCQVEESESGVQALQLLGQKTFDLIFSDIKMPQMDGIQCTKEIRKLADPTKNRIPIIAITGNAANHTPEDFRKFGFDDFIQKPLNYDLVLATVKKILS